MSKMIFKKIKKIIGMHFNTKSYLKSNRYYTVKHPLNRVLVCRAFVGNLFSRKIIMLTALAQNFFGIPLS
jgi:hypothetical protein